VCYKYRKPNRIKRAMRAAILTLLWAAALMTDASAAIWTWGCQGQLGNQQVIFTRDELYVVDAKPAGKPKPFTVESVEEGIVSLKPSKDKDSTAHYTALGGDGLEKTLEFARDGDEKKKAVFTEKTSKRLSHKHKLICGRDEDSDTFSKTYSFQREDEAARDIKMQCFEYQLSTRGGRKGCD
jgi:hypothetical protein